jgi:hypothetical protein
MPEPNMRDTYHDTKTAGLQLRVTSPGAMFFCIYCRIKGGDPERITLGRYSVTIE